MAFLFFPSMIFSYSQEAGIPSDATLLYTIELLKVEPPQSLDALSVSDRVAVA